MVKREQEAVYVHDPVYQYIPSDKSGIPLKNKREIMVLKTIADALSIFKNLNNPINVDTHKNIIIKALESLYNQ